MKVAYPVIISKGEKYLIASVPDCEIDTQGKDVIEAIEMARDAISIWCICQEDEGRELPIPSALSDISCGNGETVALVDADITAYRKKLDNRTVRKNLTLPSWLNEEAEKQNVNFSQILQSALKEHLGLGA
ncbi:MAG: type II toxin-antitoxin system HicB family antitoxin [Defluviitaleaceae bacterium]|nr:type II toxin-antitoxin system HicB family antitoxin [Defluviitaleaceae bacterium]MCL2263410.1 type II toxin-antitoxin system HicB family antitoxin [Defluviitaleaceae bacterium]